MPKPRWQDTLNEQALLGAIIVSDESFRKISGLIQPEHFAWSLHAKIFRAVLELHTQGKAVDPEAILGVINARRKIVEPYLRRVVGEAATIITVSEFAHEIVVSANARLR